jgi:tryptophanyl-tRNA synthetase
VRILTGIKPTGSPHLGNLKGAIEPALQLASQGESFYFIADYHAFTTLHNREEMRRYTHDVAATWLACGLDPKKSCLFAQSDVPEVTELSWLLTCMVGTGTLERGHAYKAALEREEESIGAGILFYPVLMAADILLYDTNLVPVGKDQKQHVEMAKDMAQSFNAKFGETLVLPEAYIREDVAVIPGIDGQKMSKSYNNHIMVFSSSKVLKKRIGEIVTDSKSLEEPKDPSTCNVFAIYKHFATPDQQAELAARYRAGNFGYGHAKLALFELLEGQLSGPRARYENLMAQPDELDAILSDGAKAARVVAQGVLERVREAAGFRRVPRT